MGFEPMTLNATSLHSKPTELFPLNTYNKTPHQFNQTKKNYQGKMGFEPMQEFLINLAN